MPAPTSATPARPSSGRLQAARWSARAGLALATLAATALVSPAPAGAATVASTGTHENGTSAVTLSGPWSTTRTTTASGGSFSSLVGRSGYASMQFKATGVSWVSRPGPYNGLAQVYLDGKLVKTVDLYRSKTAFKQTVWSVKGLSNTTHTVKVVRTGKKNSAAKGANLVFDAFKALDITAPSAPTSLKASSVRTGYTLSWTRPSASDLKSFRVYRKVKGSSTSTLIATLGSGTTSFKDVGLAASTSFTYWVRAVDSSGNTSSGSNAVDVRTAGMPSYTSVRYSSCPSATTTVSNWTQLQAAIKNAKAGTVVRMNPGTYKAPWSTEVHAYGTASAPVWICGPRSAVLTGGGAGTNGGFRVDGSSYLRIAGMTVTGSQKGISVMNSHHVAVSDTLVERIGEEAVHLKNNTSDSVVIGNTIRSTGLLTPSYGEGVYVGTSKLNWCRYNGCRTDASNRNAIVSNTISNTSAEPIDLKEGAVDGTVWGNTINGSGMKSGNTLISVQSDGWVVAKNTGSNAPVDGIQVWQVYDVWGKNNVVFGNTFTAGIPSYGVRLAYANLGNVVGCDTKVPSGSDGISNKSCQK